MRVEVHVSGRVERGRFAEYARVAMAMPFEGPLTFTILRDPLAASADGGVA